MPYWAVGIVVVVLVVVYYLLSQQGRERRREKVGVGFAKIPNFYAGTETALQELRERAGAA